MSREASLASPGNSWRQGGHQVPQKLRSVIFPESVRDSSPVSSETSEIFGRGSSVSHNENKPRKLKSNSLSAILSCDGACELHVLGHDGDPLRMDGLQVAVLKLANEIRLGCLLKRQDSGSLEADPVGKA